MKTLRFEVAVACDEDVTRAMVQNILLNHLWWSMAETQGGRIDWQNSLRVRSIGDDQGRAV